MTQVQTDIAERHARNRQIREQRRKAHEAAAGRRSSPLVRWAKWGLVPVNAAVHALRLNGLERKRRPVIEAFLKREGFKGVQFGCGKYPLPGWLNSDFVYPRNFWQPVKELESGIDVHIDITETLPFPDAALDALFAEEVIEHVGRDEGVFFLKEAVRVLRPGGVCRLTTPDARGICRVFSGGVEGIEPIRWEPFWLNPYWSDDRWLNGNFRYYGHQHLWHYEALRDAALEAGFARAERVWLHETSSGLPELEGIERHGVDDPEARELSRHVRMAVEFFR